MATEGITVELLGQELSPQSPWQGQISGFGLPLTAVIKNQIKKMLASCFNLIKIPYRYFYISHTLYSKYLHGLLIILSRSWYLHSKNDVNLSGVCLKIIAPLLEANQ